MATPVQVRPPEKVKREPNGSPKTAPAAESVMQTSRTLWLVMIAAILLVLIGGGLACWVQTAGGTVAVKDIRFMGTNGTEMSALLYVPKNATAKTPAPGILAVHGYINSRETQDGFAIEFARRGYVVLALDQTGHGYSAPPAMANGFGGPDGLKYLRTLDIVDKNNIGLEGHSMGGWASVIAAQTFPNDYKAMVLEGSSTGTYGGMTGTVSFPHNLGLVFSKYDEFSTLMWLTPRGQDANSGKKMQAQFGTTDAVKVGQLYGSIQDGTARKLYQPATTHPQDHISNEAIGNAIEWFQVTLQGGNGLAPSDQIWGWKEIGTFIAFIGFALFLFPAGGLLLRTRFFQSLNESTPEFKGASGWSWWLTAALTVAIPTLTYFWGQHEANDYINPKMFWPTIGGTPIWAQNITIGLMGWALINAFITLVLFLAWHFLLNKKTGATAVNYGVTWANKGLAWGKIGKSLLLAILVAMGGYILLAISDWWFKTDFRLWVLSLKPMNFAQFKIFLGFVIPFAVFFLVLSTALHAQLRVQGSMRREMLINAVLLSIGFVILLAVQYIPLFTSGTLGLYAIATGEPLLTIVAFQLVPLMILVALVSTYFYRKTGHVYAGAFLNAIFITWYIVAGQAIHFAV